jgi:cysteinyl-tRNA synthetase
MPTYGRLSRRPLDEMIAGARVDVAPYKRGDMDFVLWKPSKDDEPGWQSPWGRGRPGWHIECSAMSAAHLGETFDIHGGGIDLVFPHHENEIAQSCCAFGRDVMANYWMHNGFLQVEGEKMSKSLGNFVTIHELLHTEKFGGRKWPGVVLRYAMLTTHYRQPIDWTVERLKVSLKHVSDMYDRTRNAEMSALPNERVITALCDDLNTHEAIVALGKLVGDASGEAKHSGELLATCTFLGLDLEELDPKKMIAGETQIHIKRRIDDRLAARASKNWAESDRIRDELAAMGIALKDNKDGTTTLEVKR